METPSAQPAGLGDVAAGDAALLALTTERDQLRSDNADLRDQIMRLRAEFENSRRRGERERVQVIEFAAMESARQLLPILDDFERALQAHPQGDAAWRDYAKGLELIHQRLTDALFRMGVEPIESVGAPFDPNLHHAVEMTPTEDADHHTILAEFQKGYNFKGKLLRPAMVRVAVKP
ncbi:MAG: nucleotide exchange factor GrpE [Bryobacteraceae bacterium]